MAPQKQDPEVYERAFQLVAAELRNGNLVCIFPEGRLTPDGEIGEFRSGISASLIGVVPAVVVGGLGTMAVAGLWSTWFPQLRRIRHLNHAA